MFVSSCHVVLILIVIERSLWDLFLLCPEAPEMEHPWPVGGALRGGASIWPERHHFGRLPGPRSKVILKVPCIVA